MKKEFYKLSLVFVIIMFSFSIAFFLGREITLSGQKEAEESASQPKPTQTPAQKVPDPDQEPREQVSDYKKKLIDKAAKKQPALVKENIQTAPEEKKLEKKEEPKEYLILIDTYSNQENAVERSTKIKKQFPNWTVFFKKSEESYKIYVGPFNQKEKAENFLKKILEKPEFSLSKLEAL